MTRSPNVIVAVSVWPTVLFIQLKEENGLRPRGKNALVRAIIEGKIGWTPEIEETLFRCTGCRLCTQTCFPAVETNQGVLAGRACLADRSQYPKIVDRVVGGAGEQFQYFRRTE